MHRSFTDESRFSSEHEILSAHMGEKTRDLCHHLPSNVRVIVTIMAEGVSVSAGIMLDVLNTSPCLFERGTVTGVRYGGMRSEALYSCLFRGAVGP
ncbi:hypothetical protein AVEN_188267-1 [Araneus ventricosus]|uniref:Uncharacterized protein n=1 Tax=Araneus ventricosus TaxID=182803 RepID=A0A4Y2C3B1_ARAVE|nr:hypothetical protein AVEN_188267-1 [Araneus ventricosus]